MDSPVSERRKDHRRTDDAVFGYTGPDMKHVPGLIDQMAKVMQHITRRDTIDSWVIRFIGLAILAHIFGLNNLHDIQEWFR